MNPDIQEYAHSIELIDLLREPVMRSAICDLGLASGCAVLDAGCGTGSHLPLLKEQADPGGAITGVDISPEFVRMAERRIGDLGLENGIRVVEGDIDDLPFGDCAFDCVLSVDCAGYPSSDDPLKLTKELSRVLKPGGVLAIMGWTHQLLLQGYPALEARLNTASTLVTFARTDTNPGRHFLHAKGWFQAAGLVDVRGRSYAADINAPLDETRQEAVLAAFGMLWETPVEILSGDELELYRRISTPGSADCSPAGPDYYGYFVYTLFTGRLPEG